MLWDSSAILAILDADEPTHAAALETAKALAKDRCAGFITNYIEAEAHALLLSRLGRAAALHWLMHPTLAIERALAADETNARALLAQYTDKDWSLCDAVSFAVMDARGVRQAFSYDQHFRQWGKVRVIG